MEFARDLASADLWADSLERSLARRGRPRRASLALGRLTAERDLADAGTLNESIVYWRARRAATASSTFNAPAVGGASVLALLAATTLPSLAGGGTTSARRGSLQRSGGWAAGAATPARSIAQHRTWALPASTLGALSRPASAKPAAPLHHAAAAPLHHAAAAPLHHAAAAPLHHAAAAPLHHAAAAPRATGHPTLTASASRTSTHVLALGAPTVHTVAAALPATHLLAATAGDTHLLATSASAAAPTTGASAATAAAAAAAPAVASAAAPKHVAYGKIAFGDLRDTQRMLGITIDDVLGPKTGAAIRAFQAAHGLAVDGVVGRVTWFALAAAEHAAQHAAHRAAVTAARVVAVRQASTFQPAAPAQSTNDVIALQHALGIDADGTFGSATLTAVQAFQTAHGLYPDGVVGSTTRAALGLPPGPTLQPTDAVTGGTADTTAAPAPAATPAATTTVGTSTAAPTTATTPTSTDTAAAGTAPATTSTAAATTSTFGPPASIQLALDQMTAAGNQIATLPYLWGGGHGSWISPGYDCSGSVSYVLHAAGLLSVPEDSSALMSYGAPGPGQYITIYANAGHAWISINGRRFDTVALQETGNRWGAGGGEFDGFVVRHPLGY